MSDDYYTRTRNVTSTEHCVYCCRNTKGWVTVDIGNGGLSAAEHEQVRARQQQRTADDQPPLSVYGESLAPCPYCEAGYNAEFPKTERTRAANFDPPYGQNGYWQGRDFSFLQPDCVHLDGEAGRPRPEKVLSKQENALRMRLLSARYAYLRKEGASTTDEAIPNPIVGIEPVLVADDFERLKLVQAELQRVALPRVRA